MVCKNRGVYGFLGPAWVLITMALRISKKRKLKTHTSYVRRCYISNNFMNKSFS